MISRSKKAVLAASAFMALVALAGCSKPAEEDNTTKATDTNSSTKPAPTNGGAKAREMEAPPPPPP